MCLSSLLKFSNPLGSIKRKVDKLPFKSETNIRKQQVILPYYGEN
jgi:hypothetical protein